MLSRVCVDGGEKRLYYYCRYYIIDSDIPTGEGFIPVNGLSSWRGGDADKDSRIIIAALIIGRAGVLPLPFHQRQQRRDDARACAHDRPKRRRRTEQLLSAAAPLMSVRPAVQSGPVVHHHLRRLFETLRACRGLFARTLP